MSIVRLGAVSYLNTKPLVHGLDRRSDLFTVRFDVPSQCAALLHEGRIDLSSSVETGTRFRVTLPVSTGASWFK